jgi:hypothetical protein
MLYWWFLVMPNTSFDLMPSGLISLLDFTHGALKIQLLHIRFPGRRVEAAGPALPLSHVPQLPLWNIKTRWLVGRCTANSLCGAKPRSCVLTVGRWFLCNSTGKRAQSFVCYNQQIHVLKYCPKCISTNIYSINPLQMFMCWCFLFRKHFMNL